MNTSSHIRPQKIALVTGGNKGIGFELVRQMANLGIRAIIGARDPARGEEALQKLRLEGLDAAYILIDLRAASRLAGAVAH